MAEHQLLQRSAQYRQRADDLEKQQQNSTAREAAAPAAATPVQSPPAAASEAAAEKQPPPQLNAGATGQAVDAAAITAATTRASRMMSTLARVAVEADHAKRVHDAARLYRCVARRVTAHNAFLEKHGISAANTQHNMSARAKQYLQRASSLESGAPAEKRRGVAFAPGIEVEMRVDGKWHGGTVIKASRGESADAGGNEVFEVLLHNGDQAIDIAAQDLRLAPTTADVGPELGSRFNEGQLVDQYEKVLHAMRMPTFSDFASSMVHCIDHDYDELQQQTFGNSMKDLVRKAIAVNPLGVNQLLDLDDGSSSTPLHILAAKPSLPRDTSKEMTQLLLEAGADIDLLDSQGRKAMNIASSTNNSAVLQVLRKHKKKMSRRAAAGQTSGDAAAPTAAPLPHAAHSRHAMPTSAADAAAAAAITSESAAATANATAEIAQCSVSLCRAETLNPHDLKALASIFGRFAKPASSQVQGISCRNINGLELLARRVSKRISALKALQEGDATQAAKMVKTLKGMGTGKDLLAARDALQRQQEAYDRLAKLVADGEGSKARNLRRAITAAEEGSARLGGLEVAVADPVAATDVLDEARSLLLRRQSMHDANQKAITARAKAAKAKARTAAAQVGGHSCVGCLCVLGFTGAQNPDHVCNVQVAEAAAADATAVVTASIAAVIEAGRVQQEHAVLRLQCFARQQAARAAMQQAKADAAEKVKAEKIAALQAACGVWSAPPQHVVPPRSQRHVSAQCANRQKWVVERVRACLCMPLDSHRSCKSR